MFTYSTVIQAGGQSRRMGQDKGLVKLAGKPLIEHVLERVQPLTPHTLITTNNPQPYQYLGVHLVGDEQPGAGALPGLQTALTATQSDYVLVVACDMPFLHTGLLQHLLTLATQADVVVPMWAEREQTMHTVYKRKVVLAAVQQALTAGKKRMISFYPTVNVLTVPPATSQAFDAQGHTFFNVNTPDDLAQAEAIWQSL